MDPIISLTDVCSGIEFPLYLKNIVRVDQRYVTDASDGTPVEKAIGSIIHSKPGNYIDEVVESPQEVADKIVAAGGTIVFFP